MIDLAAKARADWEWFSVDYSAATDGLSWKYSGRIFRYLMQDLDERQYDAAMAVLGPHKLFYPVEGGKPEYRGTQRNGQLMGSILSFPILCLANLGVYLLTTQPSQVGWSYRERLNHVLINGDDMVYAAHPALWPVHVATGEKVGLKMSVGKAYRHPVYANVNSTSVHYDLRKMPLGLARRDLQFEPTPYQINYLNAGLFFGQHKVQEKAACESDDSDDDPELSCDNDPRALELAKAHLGQDPSRGLVVNLPTILAGALPGQQAALLRRFLNFHGPAISQECFCAIKKGGRWTPHTRNLFLPLSCGGMGVAPPVGWTYRITPADKFLASAVQKGYKRTAQLPLPEAGRLKDADDIVSAPYLKPKGSERKFYEAVDASPMREWVSLKKAVGGFVYYSPTFALEGTISKIGKSLDEAESLKELAQSYRRRSLEECIDACYDLNPVGTYDRPSRLY